MIERVAVAPHPPLLVPELVVADDPDVRWVRDACLAVAAELAAAAGKKHVFNLEGGMQAWRNAGLPTET